MPTRGSPANFSDSYDALSAPLEHYLDDADCRKWVDILGLDDSGFERRADGSGWLIWGRQPGASPPVRPVP